MKNIQRLKIIVLTLCLAVAGLFVTGRWASAQKPQVETAGQKFKSIQILNDMPADQMGKVMNMISASLGVDCKFCHTSNDGEYEKEGVEHKDTARKMMKMVFDLNKGQFNGRPEINCNSCHNGKSHPQPSFPLAAVPVTARPKQPEKGPTADELAARFLTALGGVEKVAAVKTRVIKATRLEPDGKTTEPETIWLSNGSYRSDIAYGKYIVSEIFDGTSGKKFGDGSSIELKPDEIEQIQREGQLFFPANLKAIYPKMEFRSIELVDGKEVNFVIATTAKNLRERLYFDVVTGLLVRRTASSSTVFGNFVYQVDYANYKAFGGVMLPTTINYAVPNIRWTRKIVDVKDNPVINPALFTDPRVKS